VLRGAVIDTVIGASTENLNANMLTNLLISLPVEERRQLTGRVTLHRRQHVRVGVDQPLVRSQTMST
jgi:hypothetical protein